VIGVESAGPSMLYERAHAAAVNVDPLILANALDHIAKTAARSRSQTRRIRWIERRALVALRGEEYRDIDHDLPKRPPGETQEKFVKRLGYHVAIKHRLMDALLDLHELAASSADARPEFIAAVERAGRILDGAANSLSQEQSPMIVHSSAGAA